MPRSNIFHSPSFVMGNSVCSVRDNHCCCSVHNGAGSRTSVDQKFDQLPRPAQCAGSLGASHLTHLAGIRRLCPSHHYSCWVTMRLNRSARRFAVMLASVRHARFGTRFSSARGLLIGLKTLPPSGSISFPDLAAPWVPAHAVYTARMTRRGHSVTAAGRRERGEDARSSSRSKPADA
jgi:hypothetical protein